MENFGILFSIPAALVATTVYRLILLKVSARYPWIKRVFVPCSAFVLSFFLVEVVLLAGMGAVQSRALLGPGFAFGHLLIFFLGTPALANVMVLPNPCGIVAKGFVVVPLCAVFALVLVLMQYGVSEALYGIDGTDGPFSGLPISRESR